MIISEIPTFCKESSSHPMHRILFDISQTHLPITFMRNSKFSELFSRKRIYVKYKNAILSHIGALFAHEKIRYLGICFLRNFITNVTAKHVVIVEAIKYLDKNMTICLILACEKEAIYM